MKFNNVRKFQNAYIDIVWGNVNHNGNILKYSNCLILKFNDVNRTVIIIIPTV